MRVEPSYTIKLYAEGGLTIDGSEWSHHIRLEIDGDSQYQTLVFHDETQIEFLITQLDTALQDLRCMKRQQRQRLSLS